MAVDAPTSGAAEGKSREERRGGCHERSASPSEAACSGTDAVASAPATVAESSGAEGAKAAEDGAVVANGNGKEEADDDPDDALDLLEAQRATIACLSAEEASSKLEGLPPAQAAQLLLLMGQEKRLEALGYLSDEARIAIGAAMPGGAAEALGLVLPSASASPVSSTSSPSQTVAGIEATNHGLGGTASADARNECTCTAAADGRVDELLHKDAQVGHAWAVRTSTAEESAIAEADGGGIVEAWVVDGRNRAVPGAEVVQAPPGRLHLGEESRLLRELDGSPLRPHMRRDTGDIWEARYMRRLPAPDAAAMLTNLPPAEAVRLLASVGQEERVAALAVMPPEARSAVLAAMPSNAAVATGLLGPAASSSSSWRDAADFPPARSSWEASSSQGSASGGLASWAKDTAARTAEWGSQTVPPKVSELGGKALGAAGAAAGLARQGLVQAAEGGSKVLSIAERAMPPKVSELGGRAVGAAGSAAGRARQGLVQVADKAKASELSGKAMDAAEGAAERARQGWCQVSSKVAACEAKEKLTTAATGAAGAAKLGLAQVTGMAGLMRKR